jgi:hypothetical protein
MWELVGVVGVWEQVVGDKTPRTTVCFLGSLLLSLGFLAALTNIVAHSRARGLMWRPWRGAELLYARRAFWVGVFASMH